MKSENDTGEDMDRIERETSQSIKLQCVLRRTLLRNKHSLFFATIALVLCVVAVEGKLTDRQGRGAQFENPFFDLEIAPDIRSSLR